jgi:hypothetical protein
MATKKTTRKKAAPKAKAKRKSPVKLSTADATRVRGMLREIREIGKKYKKRSYTQGKLF